jgi:hypothetical protein
METIWWNQVTNAVKYIADIKTSLLEEKNILLKYASGMPWRDYFVSSVKETVKLQNGDKKFIEVSGVDNPGQYLLQEVCKPEKRVEYRPSKGYARFFSESDDIVLHDRYLWVKIDNMEMLEKWINFAADYSKYRGNQANKAVFILECFCETSIGVKKGIKFYSYDEYIGEYDRIVFAMLASSSIKELPFIKSYLAELVANVAGNDIELAAQCILQYKLFMDNPLTFIRMAVNDKTRSNGDKFIYSKDNDEVAHLIWLSQIKTIYPYLEEYREEFVQKHYSDILEQLPIHASYGEEYNDPKDVELGTLMYMVGSGIITIGSLEQKKLKKFKEARNKLSHLTNLSIGEIEELAD